jgi:hypothetical protein
MFRECLLLLNAESLLFQTSPERHKITLKHKKKNTGFLVFCMGMKLGITYCGKNID